MLLHIICSGSFLRCADAHICCLSVHRNLGGLLNGRADNAALRIVYEVYDFVAQRMVRHFCQNQFDSICYVQVAQIENPVSLGYDVYFLLRVAVTVQTDAVEAYIAYRLAGCFYIRRYVFVTRAPPEA